LRSVDVLFIHPPRIFAKDYIEPRSAFIKLPVGLVALADYLAQNGYSTKILNIPMEIYFNKSFRLSRYLKSIDIKICAIELNWILNAYGAIQSAEIVKHIDSNVKIIIGGLSASYYYDEIIKNPSIDAIIRGEAEIPLLKLVNHYLKGTPSLKNIPNLTYKTNGSIYHNPIQYIAEDLSFLDFVNFKLLENWEKYLKVDPSISIMMGRSCPYNCVYCGGGKLSYSEICKRDHVILRDPKPIVEDIIYLKQLYPDLKIVDLTHGYYPSNHQYWIEILKLLQKENVDIGAIFEVWSLPVKELFLRESTKTFDLSKTFLNFSVHTYSERVRRILVNLGDPKLNFSNTDLYNLIAKCEKYHIPLIFWLTVGNPYETVKDFIINLKHLLSITKNYVIKRKQVILFINTAVLISPGSLAFSNENKFGVKIKEKTFNDFYKLFRDLRYSKSFFDDPVNYKTIYLSRRKIKILNNVYQGISMIPLMHSIIFNLLMHKIAYKKNKTSIK
jgi:radical SAM superfamily enzyme YgiQ (UPF0313 family)